LSANFLVKKNTKETKSMAESDSNWQNAQSIYEFKAFDIDGKLVDFSKYKLNNLI